MRTIQMVGIALSLAGSAAAMPCLAQDAPAAPDVRVETNVVQIPEVHVETDVLQSPKVQVETRVGDDGRVTIVQQRGGSNGNTRVFVNGQTADAFQNYAVAQVYQNLSALYSPEMAKKTRDIALLRQMLALKLTARDIEQALPLLRELKSADKVVPVKPEQALDEEYQNLLRARPGDPMPASSAEALRDAASGFRSRKQAIWDRMGQEIGREKAAGIRAMLRSDSIFTWSSTNTLRDLITAPPVRRRTLTRPAPKQDATSQPNLAPVPDKAPPAPGDSVSSQPVIGGDDAAPPDAPATAPRRSTARGQSVLPAVPRARALTVDPTGYRVIFGSYGQATLDELIDLFERHLAAMRR